MVHAFINIGPEPEEPEPHESEELKNPKSEFRNPKQIRNSKVQKQQTKKRLMDLEHLDLFRTSGFVLRIWNRPFPLGVWLPYYAKFDLKETNISQDLQQ